MTMFLSARSTANVATKAAYQLEAVKLMHTHTRLYALGLGVRVSPLGPRIIPLCCPCVVVDKVYSAIVLALLCGNKQEMKKRKKKGFMAFHVYGQRIKKKNTKKHNNNKTKRRNNSITTCGRSEGFALFRGEKCLTPVVENKKACVIFHCGLFSTWPACVQGSK